MIFNQMLIKTKLTRKINLQNGYFVNYFYAPEISKALKPGQFAMVGSGAYLLRPFSFYDANENEIGFLYKVIGSGTEYLSILDQNSEVIIHGPLGNHFRLPDAKNKTILIVAGGIGIATFPLFVKEASGKEYKVKILYGARSKNDFVCLDELSKFGDLHLISDDGSIEKKGFVTELLEEELCKNLNCEVYACGPTPMLKKIIEVSNKFKMVTQISFEEHMACGYGVCMSCVVKVNGKYTKTCTSGPIISSDLVEI